MKKRNPTRDVYLTSFVGGEGDYTGWRTFELGVQHRYASTDVGERPEIIEACFHRHGWLLTIALQQFAYYDNDASVRVLCSVSRNEIASLRIIFVKQT